VQNLRFCNCFNHLDQDTLSLLDVDIFKLGIKNNALQHDTSQPLKFAVLMITSHSFANKVKGLAVESWDSRDTCRELPQQTECKLQNLGMHEWALGLLDQREKSTAIKERPERIAKSILDV